MKNRKQRKIMFLLILILGITVGFALLSTTLKINGSASIKSNTWDIHWDDTSIAVTQGSVTATNPTVTTTTSTKDTVSFDVEFEMPGDFYEFEIDAINEGSVDGALELAQNWITYKSNNAETTLPEYMDFKVTYDDDTTPATGNVLLHNSSKTYKIRVEFKSGVEELPENPQPITIEVNLPYVQHKSSQQVDEGPVSITATKTTAAKNETVKVTVTATDVAAWNLHLTGAIVSDEFVGANLDGDGENTTVSREFTLDTSTAGEKVINLTGDVTDEDNHKTTINKSITITITE